MTGRALLLCLTLTGGCGSSRPSGPIALVPADAVAVADFQWQQVRADARLRAFATLPHAADTMVLPALSMDQWTEVTVFTSAPAGGPPTDCIIVRAPHAAERLAAQARGAAWTTRSIAGRPAFAALGFVALPVSDDVIAAGGEAGVAGIANVVARRGARFVDREELEGLLALARSDDPVKMLVAWPTQVRDMTRAAVAGSGSLLTWAGLDALGGLVSQVGIGRGLGLACAPSPDALRCQLVSVLETESAASLLAGSIGLLQGLSRLAPPPAGGPAPADISVSRAGSAVTLRLLLR